MHTPPPLIAPTRCARSVLGSPDRWPAARISIAWISTCQCRHQDLTSATRGGRSSASSRCAQPSRSIGKPAANMPLPDQQRQTTDGTTCADKLLGSRLPAPLEYRAPDSLQPPALRAPPSLGAGHTTLQKNDPLSSANPRRSPGFASAERPWRILKLAVTDHPRPPPATAEAVIAFVATALLSAIVDAEARHVLAGGQVPRGAVHIHPDRGSIWRIRRDLP